MATKVILGTTAVRLPTGLCRGCGNPARRVPGWRSGVAVGGHTFWAAGLAAWMIAE